MMVTLEETVPLFHREFDQTKPGLIDEDIPGFLQGAVGPQTVTFNFVNAAQMFVGLLVSIEPTVTAVLNWQSNVWTAFYNAAQNQYYAQQQDIVAQISQIQDKLDNIDTLTLRREENEEIMKGVLRWILGPDFDFSQKMCSRYLLIRSGPE